MKLSETKRLIRSRYMVKYLHRELANYLHDQEDEADFYEDGDTPPEFEEARERAVRGPILSQLGSLDTDDEELYRRCIV